MAFTVYVDGSIEAELPQGIIKFASLDALRAHVQPCRARRRGDRVAWMVMSAIGT